MLALSSSSPSASSIISKDGISGASTVSFNPESSKYTIKFYGKTIETTVTDKATIVDQWIQDINVQQPSYSFVIVGLAVELSSSITSIARKKSATFCIDDKCLILQLKYMDNFSLSIKNFLMNPNFFSVGVEVVNDINLITKDYGLNFGGDHANIKKLAMRKWPDRFHEPGLKNLAKELLGLSIKKLELVSLSNWGKRILTIEQVEYGSIHAYVSCKIGNLLLKDD
ncbi:hypothetical protein PIB30_026076 [Stylosanthes scabra]|uniref:3'-5' exonuclease domain-containing protein n=1 Tax=Stylosanthes scabra TaxID=79078 RepID=A0ABU6Y8W3_9FABA|nr:hypothetical protein [Stylosanthes scabra]